MSRCFVQVIVKSYICNKFEENYTKLVIAAAVKTYMNEGTVKTCSWES